MLFIVVLIFAGCKSPPPIIHTDSEIERNVAVARGAYAAGSAEKASGYYRKALQRARIVDLPEEIGRNAYNLAACLSIMRRYDDASACLDEARMEFGRAGITCRELSLLQAKIAMAQGHPQEAAELARAELKTPKGLDNAVQIQWRVLLADLASNQNQPAKAEAELALIDPKQLADCRADIQAQTALTRATLQMLKRNPQTAAPQYDNAAHYWQAAGRYADMAAALEQAGRAYEVADNGSAAADRYYRAARSLFESGQIAPARDLANLALKSAAVAHQPALQKQAERLKTEIDFKQQKAASTDSK